ncbi:MAG: ComF family protein, partial [Verrucomicrobiaceae bacterium]
MFPTRLPEPQGWRKWLGHALDLFYPAQCAVCRTPLSLGSALCDSCEADLPRLTEPFCKCCGEHFEGQIDGTFSCPNCSRLKFAFTFARPATVRDERTLDMIHRLKYGRQLYLAKELGRIAAGAFHDERLAPALAGKWPLVPVPLHRWRLRERHFNQAEEISRELSRFTGMPVVRALRRVRSTGHQTSLTRSQRLENLRGAFAISRAGHRAAGSPAGAVLVDDVFTTGATIQQGLVPLVGIILVGI